MNTPSRVYSTTYMYNVHEHAEYVYMIPRTVHEPEVCPCEGCSYVHVHVYHNSENVTGHYNLPLPMCKLLFRDSSTVFALFQPMSSS